MNKFEESDLLYRTKNYEVDKNVFSPTFINYDNKFMYELYYNKQRNKVLVCIQTEYFSLSSIEPRNKKYEEECSDYDNIEFLGSGEEFYNIAKNNYDIKFHCRHLDEFDIDYQQISNIYKVFIEVYEH